MSTNTRSSLLIAARNAVISVSALVASYSFVTSTELTVKDRPFSKIASSVFVNNLNNTIKPLPNYDVKKDEVIDTEVLEKLQSLVKHANKLYSFLMFDIKEFQLSRKQIAFLKKAFDVYSDGYNILNETALSLKGGLKEIPEEDNIYRTIFDESLEAKSMFKEVISSINQILREPSLCKGDLDDDDLLIIAENAREIALRNS